MSPICSTLPHTSFHLCNYVYASQKRKLAKTPPTLSGVWKNNEKIIQETPTLLHDHPFYNNFQAGLSSTIKRRTGLFFLRKSCLFPSRNAAIEGYCVGVSSTVPGKIGKKMGNDCAGNVGKKVEKADPSKNDS